MGFGANLQGKSSHDALIKQQDAEIRLLETIKKCITHRIKCDRDYALALSGVVSIANKLDNTGFTSATFQAWATVVSETENLVRFIQENMDTMCACTLERVVRLINEKRANRKLYIDERQRLEVEFAKLQEDVQRHKGEYEKVMEKLQVNQARFDDMLNRGKPGSKFDDARTKYHRQAMKLHKEHNEYVIALRNVNTHQQHYLNTTLPQLLDFQQDRQEATVAHCKDILIEYGELTDTSAEKFTKCHKNIHQKVDSINSKLEYTDFVKTNMSECLDFVKFEFEKSLLNDYKGSLKPNEISVDDLTIESLHHSRTSIEETLSAFRQKQERKQEELDKLQEEISRMGSPVNMDVSTKTGFLSHQRSAAILKKDITELQCNVQKYEQLFDLISRPLTQLGDDDPPPGVELPDIGTYEATERDKSDTASNHSHTSPDAVTPANKIAAFKSTISQMKNPFKKSIHSPPPKPPPTRDEIDTPQGSEQQRNHTAGENDAAKAKRAVSNSSDSYQQCTISDAGKVDIETPVESSRSLEEEEWFHGVLPRDEVIRLLIDDGDYLVRESKNRKTGETQYVLSVMWNGHKHFIIQGSENEWRFEGTSFPSVQQLITHQFHSEQPVTNRSQAILKKAILKEEWEIRNDDVQLGQKIGNGNFGEVFRGIYNEQDVAVKTCRETLSDDAKKKFLQEGRILKQYKHTNIVKFIGIATMRNPVMIVMEYVSGGALLTFLRRQGQNQTVRQLIKMCEDAANGMAYLEDKGCIHRDLAARNCLVGKNNIVKISDFGMSREEEEYTVSDGLKQIPIKWTAPEALNYGRYTTMCDVWSFGILMWEVFSYGATPYPGLSNNQARDKIDAGYRMPAPEGTPEQVYALMLKCWDREPDQRLHFKESFRELQRIRIEL